MIRLEKGIQDELILVLKTHKYINKQSVALPSTALYSENLILTNIFICQSAKGLILKQTINTYFTSKNRKLWRFNKITARRRNKISQQIMISSQTHFAQFFSHLHNFNILLSYRKFFWKLRRINFWGKFLKFKNSKKNKKQSYAKNLRKARKKIGFILLTKWDHVHYEPFKLKIISLWKIIICETSIENI